MHKLVKKNVMIDSFVCYMFSLTDINECENDTHSCLLSDHKVCTDTIGSYACVCQEGYNDASDICEGTLVNH